MLIKPREIELVALRLELAPMNGRPSQPPRAKRNVRPLGSCGGASDVHPEEFGRNAAGRNDKRLGCECADSERDKYENGGDCRESNTAGHRRTQLSGIGLDH